MSEKGNNKKPGLFDGADDGRTIADMSLVTRRNLLFPHRFEDSGRVSSENTEKEVSVDPPSFIEENGKIMEPGEGGKERPWKKKRYELSNKETRTYIFSAMAAGLFLVLLFIGAGWLLIQLLLWLWT